MPIGVTASKIRTVSVDPFIVPVATVGAWGPTVVTGAIKNGYINNTNGAQNDSISWDEFFGAGTWKCGVMCRSGLTRAIISVQLDGVEVAALDAYAATTGDNVMLTQSGIVIPVSGLKRLTLKLAAHNASATGYTCFVNAIGFVRTA